MWINRRIRSGMIAKIKNKPIKIKRIEDRG